MHLNEVALSDSSGITPLFISVKQASQVLGISSWSCYQLLDSGAVECRYHGRRRLVVVQSLLEYANSLPSFPAESA